MRKSFSIALAGAGIAVMSALGMSSASASVANDCAPVSHNAGGTCGTWKFDTNLEMAVKPGFGARVVGIPAPFTTGFNGTDFLITHVAGANHPAVVEWAPGGNESGMYLTDVNGQALLTSGPITAFKKWDYTGGCGPITCDGPFQNEGSLRDLQSNGANNPLTVARPNGAANQNTVFVAKR